MKIEERGDYFRKRTVPTVRLKGKWLRAAGFPAGRYLTLTVVSPGVIELRVCEQRPVDRAFEAASAKLDKALGGAA